MSSTDQCHFSCVNLLATPDAVKGESQSIPQISQLGNVDVTPGLDSQCSHSDDPRPPMHLSCLLLLLDVARPSFSHFP